MIIIVYFTSWIFILCFSTLVQCFPIADDRTIHQRHQAPQLRPLPIAGRLPKAIPIFLPPVPIIGRSMLVNHAPSRPLIPRPATSRADAPFPKLRRRAADTPYSNFVPSPYAASMMQPAMRMQQPQMFGAAPMMQQPNVYTLPKNPQYDDYDKKEDLDDDYEYAKPINMGQVGLSFGVNGGGGGAAADESSSATTSAPSSSSSWTDMFSGLMGGVAKIVQADAQKEMMGNMMKMMMLSSLVDM